MTNPNYAHLELLIDESGSMGDLKDTVKSSVNGLIAEQATIGGHATISVATFNSNGVKPRLSFAPLTKDTKFEDFVPSALTPLYDAIGERIVALGQRFAAMPESERPGIVMFAIMTDGYENASKDYTARKIKDMIKEQETVYNWQFVFLGANIDTGAVSFDLGISTSVSYLATPAGYNLAMRGISQSFTSSRTGN
jgi:hypothetical protein